MVILADRELLLSTVPKVANNSIKVAVQHTLSGEPIPDCIPNVVQYNTPTPTLEGPLESLQALLDKGWTCIGFVRNPWSRLASCWFDKFHGGATPSGNKMIQRYKWPNALTFADFVWRAIEIGHDDADGHFAPCHLFHGNWPVIRFEELSTEWPKLMQRFGLKELPHYRKRTQGDYRKMYDSSMVKAVGAYYKTDCELYHYDFQ